jgi:8-oxo-dGTP diphosphatase
LKVVIAFITDAYQRLLITQRALDSHYGGYWELPGGKLDAHEIPYQALVREIKEELNFDVMQAVGFATIEDGIEFSLFHVIEYQGNLSLNVGQMKHQWVNMSELTKYHFPKTNIKFFQCWKDYLEFNNGEFNPKA